MKKPRRNKPLQPRRQAAYSDEIVRAVFLSPASNVAMHEQYGMDPATVSLIRNRHARREATEGLTAPRRERVFRKRHFNHADVVAIYLDLRPNNIVASAYGVKTGHIWRIKRGKIWASVTGDLKKS